MKTEEFDDAIKRKLESINPAFTEKDIDRVHKYTVANRSPFALLGTTRAFWTLMATGMLVTGLITWKLTSMFVHDQHPAPIVQTRAVAPYRQDTKPTQIVAKTDTIYITKYKYINKYPDSYIPSQTYLNKKESAKEKEKIYAQLPVSENNIITRQLQNNEPVTEKAQKSDTPVKTSLGTRSPGVVEPKQSDNNTNIAETQKATNAVPDPKNTLVVKKSDTTAIAEKKEPLKKEIKKTPVHDYADEHKIASDEKPLNLNFMIGAGAETTLGNPQSGGGIFAKLFFNNKFSINAGLKLMNVNHQYYENDADFISANGHPFEWTYAQYLIQPWNNPKFTDIDFTYTLWQVPISFEYYFPITHAFSISASFGTDLDISCSNKLSYSYSYEDHYGAMTNPINVSKINNYAPVPINNAVGSVGFIYQFHHLVLQLSPYVTKQDVNVWYKGKTEWYEGASFKVFYSF